MSINRAELGANLFKRIGIINRITGERRKEDLKRSRATQHFLDRVQGMKPSVLDDLYEIFLLTRIAMTDGIKPAVFADKLPEEDIARRIKQWQKRHYLESQEILDIATSTVRIQHFLWALEGESLPEKKWFIELCPHFMKYVYPSGIPESAPVMVPFEPFTPSQGWVPKGESLAEALSRLETEFKEHLRRYRGVCESLKRFIHEEDWPEEESEDPALEWLAARQVHGWSYDRIAKEYLKAQPEQRLHSRVGRGIRRVAKLLQLSIRPTRRASGDQ